jgi:ribosomal protein S18 acetylase RimI-like enzyme
MDYTGTGLETLVRLKKSDVKPTAEMLAGAFHNYPLLANVFHDEAGRARVASLYFQLELGYAVRYGEVYATSPNLEGVATWLHSDSFPMTAWRTIRSVPLSVIRSFASEGGVRLKPIGDYLDARHRAVAPFTHWYLQTIGVAPSFRGKGWASRLVRPMLTRAGREGLPCYLETMEEANVRLYEHFGFRVVEISPIPNTSLTNWAMLWEAR